MTARLTIAATLLSVNCGVISAEVPSLNECPKQILRLLEGDVRRAFLNVTFSAQTQSEEDKKVSELLANAFGGPYLTFDPNDEDNEYQATITDGVGNKKRIISFLYNRSGTGWELAGVLQGGFPVGAPQKHDGWRDITTRERIPGPQFSELMRTYRYTNGAYTEIRQSIDSGG